MSIDRREAILAAMQAALAGAGFACERNTPEPADGKGPNAIITDGLEELVADPPLTHISSTKPLTMRMVTTVEIYDRTQASSATHINALRMQAVKAVLADEVLRAACQPAGALRYAGCGPSATFMAEVDVASISLTFHLHYVFNPAEL